MWKAGCLGWGCRATKSPETKDISVAGRYTIPVSCAFSSSRRMARQSPAAQFVGRLQSSLLICRSYVPRPLVDAWKLRECQTLYIYIYTLYFSLYTHTYDNLIYKLVTIRDLREWLNIKNRTVRTIHSHCSYVNVVALSQASYYTVLTLVVMWGDKMPVWWDEVKWMMEALWGSAGLTAVLTSWG